jgi:hypothetical protein
MVNLPRRNGLINIEPNVVTTGNTSVVLISEQFWCCLSASIFPPPGVATVIDPCLIINNECFIGGRGKLKAVTVMTKFGDNFYLFSDFWSIKQKIITSTTISNVCL